MQSLYQENYFTLKSKLIIGTTKNKEMQGTEYKRLYKVFIKKVVLF